MSLDEIKDHINDLSTSWEEFKRVNNQRLNELSKGDGVNVLTVEHLNRLNKVMDDCKDKLDKLAVSGDRPRLDRQGADDSALRSMMADYIRTGNDSHIKELHSKSSDGGAGSIAREFLFTGQASDFIADSVHKMCLMRKLASVEAISADYLTLLHDATGLAASWGDQAITSGTDTALKISAVNIFTHDLHVVTHAAQRFLDDCVIDIEMWLAKTLANFFAIDEEKAFFNGAGGESQPEGILHYVAANQSQSPRKVQVIKGKAVELISFEKLMALYYSLSDAYHSNAAFIMNGDTIRQVRGIATPDNVSAHYIWEPPSGPGEPEKLLGVPLYRSEHMHKTTEVQSNDGLAQLAILGDFERAYKIVDRKGISILRDPFVKKPHVAFYATKRLGGKVIDHNAIRVLGATG